MNLNQQTKKKRRKDSIFTMLGCRNKLVNEPGDSSRCSCTPAINIPPPTLRHRNPWRNERKIWKGDRGRRTSGGGRGGLRMSGERVGFMFG